MLPSEIPTQENPASLIETTPAELSSIPITLCLLSKVNCRITHSAFYIAKLFILKFNDVYFFIIGSKVFPYSLFSCFKEITFLYLFHYFLYRKKQSPPSILHSISFSFSNLNVFTSNGSKLMLS